MSIVNSSLQNARATTAAIAASSAVPLDGQIVYNSQTGQYKIGDGVTTLSALTYYGGSSALTINTTTITSGTNTRILYNNAGVVGEYLVTGTGTTAVLSTSPTFTTGIQINTGTNSGRAFELFQDTASVKIGSLAGATSEGGIYINAATPSAFNYVLRASTSTTIINGQSSLVFASGATNCGSVNSSGSWTFNSFVNTSGAITPFTITVPANTNQTLSTNIPNFKVTGSTKQWATGALATQYFNYFSANTVSFVGASTATNVYGLYVEAATAGTNATITNNYAAGFSGNVNIIGDPYINGVAPTGTGSAVLSTSPAFGTDITTPLIYGSSASGGNLTIQSTSNATKGKIFHGATTTDTKHVFYVGTGVSAVQIRSLVGTLSQSAIYLGVAPGSETSANYAFNWSGALNLNSQGVTNGIDFQQGSQSRMTLYGASTNGTNPRWLINFPQQTGLTASTESNDFLINSKTQTYLAGTQTMLRGLYYKTQSIAFASGLNAVTTYYTAYFESGTAGANCSGITNNYSLGTAGKAKFGGNIELTQTVTTEVVASDTTVTIVINGTTYKLLARA